LLGIRARTELELRTALRDKAIEEPVVNDVIAKFDRAGLIDDAAFAKSWVRSRHQFSGLSRRAVIAELRRKGVDDTIALEAAEEIDNDSEEQRARELARKKLRSMRGLEDQVALRRLVGALARKGYSQGLSFRVASEALSASNLTDVATEFADD
jgi:regulatory protein